MRWAAPDPQHCDAVAVDHVHFRGDSNVITDAAVWCSVHCKPLILAEVLRVDLDAIGGFVDVDVDVAELNLNEAMVALGESLPVVPVPHWWKAIRRAENAQDAISNQVRSEECKLNDATPSRKTLDGRTKERRAARLAAQNGSA